MATLESLLDLRNDLVLKFALGAVFVGDQSAATVPDLFSTTTVAAVSARTVADAATTSASTTVTSATAAFTTADVGTAITGAGIPAGATIVSCTSATAVVLSAPATVTATAVSITFGAHDAIAAGATLQALPTGYKSGGLITTDGITLNRDITVDDVMAWQTTEVVRSDTSADKTTVQFGLQETNPVSIALAENALLADVPALGSPVRLDRAPTAFEPLRRLLIVGHDVQNDVILGRYFPRVKVTAHDAQKLARTDPTVYPFTLTAYQDPAYGTSCRYFIGGAGWLAYS